MRRIALLLALATALIAIAAGVAVADPSLSDVAAHRHFVETENGLVEVGPRLCDDPSLQDAFNQFHANVHTHNGVTGEIGPVAPGLHNGTAPSSCRAGARSCRSRTTMTLREA